MKSRNVEACLDSGEGDDDERIKSSSRKAVNFKAAASDNRNP